MFGRLNIVVYLSLKLTYIFNTIPVLISARLIVDIDKLILKFIWEGKNKTAIKLLRKLDDLQYLILGHGTNLKYLTSVWY